MEIITTKPIHPPRIIIYGDHKIGKTTFGASMPNPIFIRTEDGSDMVTVKAFKDIHSFDDIFKAIDFLYSKEHDFKTLVIDSLDWSEALLYQELCAKNGWTNVAEGPFGKGYKLALGKWEGLKNDIDLLHKEKHMIICLLAHSKISRFEDPERESYDKYSLDLYEKASQMWSEWADIIGFLSQKVITNEESAGFSKTVKTKSTGQRVLNLSPKAAFNAGNRYDLPDYLIIPKTGGWSVLGEAIRKSMSEKLTEINKQLEKQKGENKDDN